MDAFFTNNEVLENSSLLKVRLQTSIKQTCFPEIRREVWPYTCPTITTLILIMDMEESTILEELSVEIGKRDIDPLFVKSFTIHDDYNGSRSIRVDIQMVVA